MKIFCSTYKKEQILRKIELLMLLFLLTSFLGSVSVAKAIDTGYGGPAPSLENTDLINSISLWYSGGPRMSSHDVMKLNQLADSGVRIVYGIMLWGEPGTEGHNALDVYYNETFRRQVEQIVDYNFNGIPPDFYPKNVDLSWDGIDPNKIWAVSIGEEEPGGYEESEFYDTLSEDIARYSDVYYDETGFQLKPLLEMNKTEEIVFWEWFTEKNVWTYNHLYDYIKSKWPHLLVYQFAFMEPIWGLAHEVVPPYELKADGYVIDCYYAYENPWLLYETIRRYKGTFPDKPFHIILWGTIWDFFNEPGDQLYYKIGSFEDIRREAWLSYLGGADAIIWFTWGPQDDKGYDWRWGHERTDLLGRQIMAFLNHINRDLAKLPSFNSSPQILALGSGVQTGQPMTNFVDIKLFSEFDAVNERAFAKTDLNLSKYDLIVVINEIYHEETVKKLNEYVADGGNILFLRGLGDQQNIFGNGTRMKFSIEKNISQININGHVVINITRPNPLDLEMNYNSYLYSGSMLSIENMTDDYHPIGDFYLIEDGNATKLNESSLVLYHNKSDPNSGWILYWGVQASSQTPGITWDDYDYENQTDLWFLYREVLRAFANFLNITNSVSLKDNENILATQGLYDNDTIIVGISNLYFHKNRSFTYSFDLLHFGFSPGTYWVHSLDSNTTIGQFESNGSILSFPVDVIRNGTRLFLVSKTKPVQNFTITIFPSIPTEDELPELPPLEPEPIDWFSILFNLGVIAIVVVTVVMAVVIIKKRLLRRKEHESY